MGYDSNYHFGGRIQIINSMTEILLSPGSMKVEIEAAGLAGSGMDEHETSPRETGTKNAKWRLDYTARYGETSRVFLNLAHF